MATGLTRRRGCLGCLVSGSGLLTTFNLQLYPWHLAGPRPRAVEGGPGRAGRSRRFSGLFPMAEFPLTGTGLVSLLGSVGPSKAGVGPPAFPGLGGCGLFHGLPYLFLEDPPVGASEVSDVVPGVSTVTINWWGNHPSHPLWHFILGTRGLVVGVGSYSYRLLIRLVRVALPQWDPGLGLFLSSPLYVRQVSVQGSGVQRQRLRYISGAGR